MLTIAALTFVDRATRGHEGTPIAYSWPRDGPRTAQFWGELRLALMVHFRYRSVTRWKSVIFESCGATSPILPRVATSRVLSAGVVSRSPMKQHRSTRMLTKTASEYASTVEYRRNEVSLLPSHESSPVSRRLYNLKVQQRTCGLATTKSTSKNAIYFWKDDTVGEDGAIIETPPHNSHLDYLQSRIPGSTNPHTTTVLPCRARDTDTFRMNSKSPRETSRHTTFSFNMKDSVC